MATRQWNEMKPKHVAKRRRTGYTTSVRAMRRRKRIRLRRILLSAEALAVACFLYLLFSALPSLVSSAQEAQRLNEYKEEHMYTGTAGAMSVDTTGRTDEPLMDGRGVVVLDAGHGGKDVGCLRGDIYEKDINLAIAELTRDALRARGYDVVMVRTDDTFYELYERAAYANHYEELDDAVFVSIHVNAMEDDASVTGIECFANRYANDASPLLADALAQGVSSATGARLRKTEEESDLYVISHTLIPSCLVEVGFLSSDTEYALLTDPAYQAKIADGIADGVDTYFE